MQNIFKILQRNMSRSSNSNHFQKLIFGKYLLLTNTISSGLLMAIGDLIQQEVEYRRKILDKRYDWGRLFRMTTVGTALGPVHHYYYTYLDKILPRSDLKSVFKKMALDEIIAAPICIALFFYGMGMLESKTLRQSHNELKDKFVTVFLVDLCIWPPTQFVNFYYVPSKYRVLYINFITMLYDVFLSYVKHVDEPKKSY